MSKKAINDTAATELIDGSSDNHVLTKVELAQRLRIGKRTLDNWQHQKRIPVLKIGKTCRYRWRDVVEALSRYRVN